MKTFKDGEGYLKHDIQGSYILNQNKYILICIIKILIFHNDKNPQQRKI